MNQEILLERRGNAIHLVYRHFRDPLAAYMLGHQLELTEVAPPGTDGGKELPETNGHATNGQPGGSGQGAGDGHHPRSEGSSDGDFIPGLHCGEYYQAPLETGDNELHALVPLSRVTEVEQAVRTWHVPVVEGADLLSEAGTAETHAPAPEVVPEAVPARSMARIGGAILLVLSLLALAGALVFLGWRTLSREEITMASCMARATEAPAEGTGAALRRWALARPVSIPLRQVLFLGETKLVLADGSFVAIEGAGDLRTLLPLAKAENQEPVIETAAWPPSPAGEFPVLRVDRIRCGQAIFSRAGTIRPLAVLTPAMHRPDRSPKRQPESFWLVNDLRYDDSRRLARLAGQRISVSGRVTIEGQERVLRLGDGTGVRLAPLPAGSRVEPFLSGLANDNPELQVDLVFERVLPWRNAAHPTESRQQTQIAGVGRVISVSVESLVLADAD